MEKTAMQMLREHLVANMNGLNADRNERMGKQEEEKHLNRIITLKMVIADIDRFLPTEQQQIEAAYKDGLTMGHVTGETALKSASDYFTTKYTTP
jgi:hypothetical protein